MIRVIAIDDEPPALELLEHFCSRTDFLSLQKTCTRPLAALEYLDTHEVDLLFLDIQMPSVSGIEFVKKIKQTLPVIFTTAYSQYALDGFNLNAVDYLLKPYTFTRFLQAAHKAREMYTLQRQLQKPVTYLTIRADYSLIKIPTADIKYVEGLDNYLKLHLANAKPMLVRMTLKNLLEELPPSDFLRVHRSYIVQLSYIKNIRNKTITIGEAVIPISNNYEEDFRKVFLGK